MVKSDKREMAADALRYIRFGEGPDETGIPYLPCYYSYLIKLSSEVGIAEVYPWIAELMFHSTTTTLGDLKKIKTNIGGGKIECGLSLGRINTVYFSIDDAMDNIGDSTIDIESEFFQKTEDALADYMANRISRNEDTKPFPLVCAVDTFGAFGRDSEPVWVVTTETKNQKEEPKKGGALFNTSNLVGSGNPMRLLQRFSALGSMTEDGKVNRYLAYEKKRGQESALNPEKTTKDLTGAFGAANCIVINSISNLARALGFRDAMQVVRTMIERALWELGDFEKGKALMGRPGILFGVLNEGVFREEEIRYAETFFDGIIRFDAEPLKIAKEKEISEIYYEIERFPLVERGLSEKRIMYRPWKNGESGGEVRWPGFSPNYGCRYHYVPRAGTRLTDVRVAWRPDAANKETSVVAAGKEG